MRHATMRMKIVSAQRGKHVSGLYRVVMISCLGVSCVCRACVHELCCCLLGILSSLRVHCFELGS